MAEKVINDFGGVRATARELGIWPEYVSRWKRPKEKGGGGGLIPVNYWPKLRKAANQKGHKNYGETLLDLFEQCAGIYG